MMTAFDWSWSSLASLAQFACTMFGVLLYVFVCENSNTLVSRLDRIESTGLYWFCVIIFLLASLLTLRASNSAATPLPPVNRHQTEEWKGWMQFMFIAYHYYHAESVYNAIRVMVSCYVWLTGFGNLSFFYTRHDFSFVRVWQMLWRLNLFVLLLCAVTGNAYGLYYIVPLHTLHFALTFLTMRVYAHLNHSMWGIRGKLMLLGCILFLLWDIPGVYDYTLLPFLGRELQFRTALDHYSSLFGMIFALNFPTTQAWLARVEALSTRARRGVYALCTCVVLCAYAAWATALSTMPKRAFNMLHPYTFLPLLLGYLLLRNLSPWLRAHHIELLHGLGKITLETYLLQHHCWLADAAKTRLTLLPHSPLVNLILVTAIFLLVSQAAYRSTIALRALLAPQETRRCLRFIAVQSVALTLLLLAAAAIAPLPPSQRILAIGVCGLALACLVAAKVECVRRSHPQAVPAAATSAAMEAGAGDSSPPASSSSLRMPAVIAAVAVLVLVPVSFAVTGSYFQQQRANGAAQAEAEAARLHPCYQRLNSGTWVPASSFTCYDVACRRNRLPGDSRPVWQWDGAATTSCKLAGPQRPEAALASLSKAHTHRVVVIGDSSARLLFHALRRALIPRDGRPGNDAALAATLSPLALPRHSDMQYTLRTHKHDKGAASDLTLSFLWAPFVQNATHAVQRLRSSGAADAVVVGVGLWDMLHTRSLPAYHKAIAALVSELNALASPSASKKSPDAPPAASLLTLTRLEPSKLSQAKKPWLTPASVAAYNGAIATTLDTAGPSVSLMDLGTMSDHLAAFYEKSRAASTVVQSAAAGSTAGVGADVTTDGVHFGSTLYDGGAQLVLGAIALRARLSRTAVTTFPCNPLLGVSSLLVAAVLLLSRDNFGGLQRFALCAVGDWQELDVRAAYDELHASLRLPSDAVAALAAVTQRERGPNGPALSRSSNLRRYAHIGLLGALLLVSRALISAHSVSTSSGHSSQLVWSWLQPASQH